MWACVRITMSVRALQSYGKSNMANRHMANWLIWRTDYGKPANGETTSYQKKYHELFWQNFFNFKQILQCLVQMLQALKLGFECCWKMLDISSTIWNISQKTGQFFILTLVAPSGGGISTFIFFFLRNGVYKLFLVHKSTLGFGLKWCPKFFSIKECFCAISVALTQLKKKCRV